MHDMQQKSLQESAQKYNSIHNMTKSEKVQTLKDPKLDPTGLIDGFDVLANDSHRWTLIGAEAQRQGFDDKTKEAMASHYFDTMIAPAYQKLGRAPIDKALWMKEAYGEALKYKIEDSYHSSLVNGFINGDGSGTAALTRAAQFFIDVLGYGSKLTSDVVTKKDFSWYDEYQALMSGQRHTGNFMGGIEERIQKSPMLGVVGKILGLPDNHVFGKVSTFLGSTADKLQYQTDIVPNQGVIEKATSFITEQALMTPLYMGAAEGAGLVAKSAGALAPKTLTELLNLSPKGQAAVKLLTVGGEGGLVGITTRPNDERVDAWKDALAWMAMHTMFSVGTFGLGKSSVKLGEILQGKSKEKFERLDNEYRLNSQDMRSQTVEEVQNGAEEKIANTMTAAGVHKPYLDYQQAESMLRKAQEQGLSEKELQKVTDGLIKHDKAYWTDPVAAMKHIRSILGDTNISEIVPGSEEHQELWGKIHDTIAGAATHMNTHVAPLQEAAAASAIEQASATPSGKQVLETLKQKIKQEYESTGHPPLTDEQYTKMAAQTYKESAVGQAKMAEAERKPAVVQAAEGKAEATKITVAKTKAINEAAGLMRRRETFFKDAKGRNIGYSLSYSKSYNVYALEKGGKSKTLTGAAFNAYLKKYLTDLSPKNFSEDLNDYWLPKILQEENISFETELTAEGKENPNLLAFAWNYKDAMPAPLRSELEKRFAEQPKMQQAVKGSLKSHHMDYFAETMLAHVDEFFRARSLLKDQYKIWRSTASEEYLKPTQFQMTLQKQVAGLEKAELKAACAGNMRLFADTWELLDKLQKGRRSATLKGVRSYTSGRDRLDASDAIQELLNNPFQYERGK